jgi:hypothetical protein
MNCSKNFIPIGVADVAFLVGVQTRGRGERGGGLGKGATGAVFSAGACDSGRTGVRTRTSIRRSGR